LPKEQRKIFTVNNKKDFENKIEGWIARMERYGWPSWYTVKKGQIIFLICKEI
jgi:hypothetical protein